MSEEEPRWRQVVEQDRTERQAKLQATRKEPLPVFSGLTGVQFGTKPPLSLATPRQPIQQPPFPARSSYQFQVSDASNVIDGAQVSVRAGSIQDFSDNPPTIPTGMNEDNDPLFILPVGATGRVWIELTVNVDLGDTSNYGNIISALVDTGASLPANDYATGLYYIELAAVTVSGGTVAASQIAGGSFGFQLCGELGIYWSLGTV